MPFVPFRGVGIALILVGLAVGIATFVLARAYLIRIRALSLGQTPSFVRKISRMPVTERLHELKNSSSSQTIAWRIAHEALQVDDVQRAAIVDDVLGEIALELEARALWPRAAVRIAGASGVFLMAVSIALHLEVIVSVMLLLNGIVFAVICMIIQQQAQTGALEIRRDVDALIDALGIRSVPEGREPSDNLRRTDRRGRRRFAKS